MTLRPLYPTASLPVMPVRTVALLERDSREGLDTDGIGPGDDIEPGDGVDPGYDYVIKYD
jgi:hypothetical protein